MVREFAVVVPALLALLITTGGASAKVYRVSDMKALHEACETLANPGDAIEMQPGTYFLDSRFVHVLRSGAPGKPITIRGVVRNGKTPVIDASKVNVDRGIFRLEQDTHDVAFEDLELCNAKGTRLSDRKSYGYNAGAIYVQGDRIEMRRLHVHHNEMGLFATHAADHILVEHCEVDHNGTQSPEGEGPTHNFYFNARHQVVRNCYIHHSIEAQNFKSRGGNTILAYNWIEEDAGYSVEVASDNAGNTLWFGNLIIKRRNPEGMHRILGVGDGSGGPAVGTLWLINNTIISTTPSDPILFTHPTSTTDVVLRNNVFAGPSTHFLDWRGQGKLSGSHNWFRRGTQVPDTLGDSLFGDDPGFANPAGGDFHPRPGSPLLGAAVPARAPLTGKALLDLVVPKYEPTKAYLTAVKRDDADHLSLGAFGPARSVQ